MLSTRSPNSIIWGPMFRYERPQKGRYRQFHQIGAEAVGVDDPMMDAQVLAMLCHYFEAVDIDKVELHINSLGCQECRPQYRQALTSYLDSRLQALCADCQRRYLTNPLRVLDCKVPTCQEATADAPSVLDLLCNGCNEHFNQVQQHLKNLNIGLHHQPPHGARSRLLHQNHFRNGHQPARFPECRCRRRSL